MASFTKVARASEIPEGTGREVMVAGRRLALFNVAGTFHAIDGTCPHQGGRLGEGFLKGSVVTCPLHFWQYDVVKGHAPDFPEATIPTFRVRVEQGDVLVEV